MSIDIILLTIHVTLCSIGFVVVYAAVAAVAYGDVFRNEYSWDRNLFSALWPIFLTFHFLSVVFAMTPFRKLGSVFVDVWAATFKRLCDSIEDIAKALESSGEIENDMQCASKGPITCDVCREKLKQGAYR